jgi:hypothetical protein
MFQNLQGASKCALLIGDNLRRPVEYFLRRENVRIVYARKITHPKILESLRGKHVNEEKHWPGAGGPRAAVHYSEVGGQAFKNSKYCHSHLRTGKSEADWVSQSFAVSKNILYYSHACPVGIKIGNLFSIEL